MRGAYTGFSVLFVMVIAAPSSVWAQHSDPLHATLRTWDENSWLLIAHRDGSRDGRFSKKGILQRYDELIDGEYQLDLMSIQFPLVDEYEWWRSANGFRWAGSSVSREYLVTQGSFRSRFDINESWDIGARVDLETNHQFERALVRVDGSRSLGKSVRIEGRMGLDATKPDSDIELGLVWGRDTDRQARLTLAMLDFLNNVIHVGLKAYQQAETDSTVRYTKQPFAAHGQVDYAISPLVRFEFYGAATTPTTVQVYEADKATRGFEQDEQIAYAGGNIEVAPGGTLRLGGFGTYISASTDRRNLSDDIRDPEYDLTETTVNAGLYILKRFTRKMHIEAFGLRQWRTESRVFQNNQPSDLDLPEYQDVDYQDVGWLGQIMFIMRPPVSGFQLDMSLSADLREITRGDGEVPTGDFPIDRNNYRGRLDLGWRFTPNLSGWIGTGFDLDGDGTGNVHGGGRGRLTFTW